MSENQYIYSVARIRCHELTLLSGVFIDQLLAAKTYADARKLLADRAWGNGAEGSDEALLSAEHAKTWDLIREVGGDLSDFRVLLYPNDFHNLKAAVKETCTKNRHADTFLTPGTVEPELIEKAVAEQKYELLPEMMRDTAERAFQLLLHTGDAQQCDILIDREALLAVGRAAQESGNAMLRKYAELTIALTDLKIAVRAVKIGKKEEFLKKALAPCRSLDMDALMTAAGQGLDALYGQILLTEYRDAVGQLKTSMSAFERWCDNQVMELIRPELYDPCTIAPLAAYILARENEIKMVRIILSGRQNGLSEQSIRERVREMYV